jgi:hypothetical protein
MGLSNNYSEEFASDIICLRSGFTQVINRRRQKTNLLFPSGLIYQQYAAIKKAG